MTIFNYLLSIYILLGVYGFVRHFLLVLELWWAIEATVFT